MNDAMRRLKMTVFLPAGRAMYVMRWTDPRTKRILQQSTRLKRKRDAFNHAAEFARRAVENLPTGDILWEDFCDRYERLVMDKRPGRSAEPWNAVRARITALGPPQHLNEITTAWVTEWQHKLEQSGLKPNTIASHSARLKAALHWAVDQGHLERLPKIVVTIEEKPRSRAISLEEFERILAAAKLVRPADWPLWCRMLRGQWECGFRLSEVLALSWDEAAPVRIDDSGRRPVVLVAAAANKKRKPRVRPITPEFWMICQETPKAERSGRVFPLPITERRRIVEVIKEFGCRAGVVTNPDTRKTASSHDIRRAFASRMLGKLTLAEVQKWMDHRDISTTLTYYHTADAENLMERLWQP